MASLASSLRFESSIAFFWRLISDKTILGACLVCSLLCNVCVCVWCVCVYEREREREFVCERERESARERERERERERQSEKERETSVCECAGGEWGAEGPK